MSLHQNAKYSFKNGKRILNLSKNSLYSPLPIPAYKVLALTGEHFAANVLMCLVSHLGYGKESNTVRPSIKTIMEMTGHGERSVRKGLDALIANGFIKKTTNRKGKIQHCEYEIADLCYLMTDAFKQSIAAARMAKMLHKIALAEAKALASNHAPNNTQMDTEINQCPIDPFLS